MQKDYKFRPTTMLAHRVSRIVLTSNTKCKFRCFPKLPSDLTIHWKVSQSLLKDVILIAKIYYREKIQIQVSQNKRFINHGLGGFSYGPSIVLPN